MHQASRDSCRGARSSPVDLRNWSVLAALGLSVGDFAVEAEDADDPDADAGACAPAPEASLCAVGGAVWSGIVGGGI